MNYVMISENMWDLAQKAMRSPYDVEHNETARFVEMQKDEDHWMFLPPMIVKQIKNLVEQGKAMQAQAANNPPPSPQPIPQGVPAVPQPVETPQNKSEAAPETAVPDTNQAKDKAAKA